MPQKKRKLGRTIRVVELFAGVGGFRIGLERASGQGADFQVVFSNQWEPGRKKQHASDTYQARFGDADHFNCDIGTIEVERIPDHDLLVAGFPCQDYSVASTLRNSKGLVGKKGVLWWQIHRILSGMDTPPSHLILENVDRLLGSPAQQRGRDLAVMLSSLWALGYAVEWRVINAAEYGMPQRRKRIFLVGHRLAASKQRAWSKDASGILQGGHGALSNAFPCVLTAGIERIELEKDLVEISAAFNSGGGASPFRNAGFMVNGSVFTAKVESTFTGACKTLGDVLQQTRSVPSSFFIPKEELDQWRYLKGPKREERTNGESGWKYHYTEGRMVFPDPIDRPSRTIITGEGGRAPSRFKHVIRTASGKYRRLTPVELERLNMFPDDHTKGVSDAWRAFFMGNALVIGVVERIGQALKEHMKEAR